MKKKSSLSKLMLAATGGLLFASTTASLAADAAAAAPAPPAEPPKPKWDASAVLGLSLTSGNSESILVTMGILAEKKWDRNDFRTGADAGYGKADDNKNNDYIRGFMQYDRMFSERFFGYARVQGKHDDMAGVMYRAMFSPGVGYYFLKDKKTLLSGEVGPGVVTERTVFDPDLTNANKTETEYDSSTYMTLRVAERFEYKITEKAKIWQSVEFLPEVGDWGNYIINAEIGIESPLSQRLSLRLVAQDSYDAQPPPGLKENDLKVIAGLAYKF